MTQTPPPGAILPMTPKMLKAAAAEYDETISSLNARLADRGMQVANMSDEIAALRARVKELESGPDA